MEYVLVDGYNVIYSWPDVFKPGEEPLEDMRDRLIAILADYQGYKGCEVVLVFDAHFVKNNAGSELNYGRLKVVFTKEHYSADNYIERFVYLNAGENAVKVVTGDSLEQSLVLFGGGLRVTPDEFLKELRAEKKNSQEYVRHRQGIAGRRGINSVLSSLDSDVRDILEKIRMAD
ncbi:MAG: NYN domain-containing protein [Clostridiales bacterium]|nr:NYN domain-containing protein [Clostridiales bacterium]